MNKIEIEKKYGTENFIEADKIYEIASSIGDIENVYPKIISLIKEDVVTYYSVLKKNKKNEFTTIKGIKHGPYKKYHRTGFLKIESNYANDVLNGLYKERHEYGQLCKECNYVNGKLHGLYQEWYGNGQLFKECNYVNGELHGLYKSWYESGQLFKECNYVNGELHGLYKNWYANGQLNIESNYVNGELHGLYKNWYESGQLNIESNYVNGRLHGLCKKCDYKGKVKEFYYYKGVLIEKRWFTNPESITTKEWLSINNAEHRRVLMDIFKEKNIKAPIELVKIDECDKCILYKSKEKDRLLNEYIHYAFVVCPSTKREYYIPVPPSVRKAKDAVPWTFNRLASNYAPIIET